MKMYLLVILILCLNVMGSPVWSCTGLVATDGQRVLVGNNEDYCQPFTKVWFLQPAKSRYGCVFFGFDNFWPQGGMNQKGLFFDSYHLKAEEVTGQEGKPRFKGNLIKKMMTACATVDEALTLLNKYNLSMLREFQIFIADAGGDAAIIEGSAVVRKTGRYQVATNFRQSKTDPQDISCPRYKIAQDMLAQNSEVSIPRIRRILAAVHNEGDYPTLYSNIYDLSAGKVYLYYFHNFQEEVLIDLEEALKNKTGELDLPTLFPPNHAARVFLDRFVALDAEYTHESPHFTVHYPQLYRMGKPLDPSQVFLAHHPHCQAPVLTISVVPAEAEMPPARVGPDVYGPVLKRLGEQVVIVKNQPARLADGSAAYETRFTWQYEGHTSVNSLVISTLREDRVISVALHHTGELDPLKSIPYSLSFK